MKDSYALLLCNGEMPPGELLRDLAASAETVICADGGANGALRLGIIPATVIGDFDSIEDDTRRELAERGADFIHLERQDDTDFEKALLHLEAVGPRRVVMAGVTGGLLDHTLGNMSIILRHMRLLRMVLYDTHYRIDVIDGDTRFSSIPGERVSIVPLRPSRGVRYEGLRYQYALPVMAMGVGEGTCNEAMETAFTVHVEDGALLVFRALPAPQGV